MTYYTIRCLHIVSLASNGHRCVGIVKYVVNDLVRVLNPQVFPILFFKVGEFVARVEN